MSPPPYARVVSRGADPVVWWRGFQVAARELAFGARELDAKAADRKWGDFPTIQPHLLTPAVARLRREGVVSYEAAPTRGGGIQRVYVVASPSKTAMRVAGRKRLLLARYRTWATAGKDWNPSPVGSALERVVHASLLETAPFGYRLVNPAGGDVRDVLGARVPGGPLDSAACGVSAAGAP